MKDASQNARAAAMLLDTQERKSMEEQLKADYEQLRENYQASQQQILSLEEARQRKLNVFGQDGGPETASSEKAEDEKTKHSF